jgi:hypothetical protein
VYRDPLLWKRSPCLTRKWLSRPVLGDPFTTGWPAEAVRLAVGAGPIEGSAEEAGLGWGRRADPSTQKFFARREQGTRALLRYVTSLVRMFAIRVRRARQPLVRASFSTRNDAHSFGIAG